MAVIDERADNPLEAVEGSNGHREYRKPDGSMSKQANQVNGAVKQLRIQHVLNWLLEGNSSADTAKMVAEKWDVSERTGWRYIAEAKARMEAAAQQQIKGAAMAQLYNLAELYDSAVKAGDLKTALDIIKTQNRMLGLNAPDKVETASVERFESMSMSEQLKYFGERFEEIAKRDEKMQSRDDVN